MTNEQFTQEYRAIVQKALEWSAIARTDGLLALEESIDKEKFIERDAFEVGMLFAIDGRDPAFIEKVLINFINTEQDAEKKALKTIQKEAVLAIQDGVPTHLLSVLLNSYANIDVEETMRNYFPK